MSDRRGRGRGRGRGNRRNGSVPGGPGLTKHDSDSTPGKDVSRSNIYAPGSSSHDRETPRDDHVKATPPITQVATLSPAQAAPSKSKVAPEGPPKQAECTTRGHIKKQQPPTAPSVTSCSAQAAPSKSKVAPEGPPKQAECTTRGQIKKQQPPTAPSVTSCSAQASGTSSTSLTPVKEIPHKQVESRGHNVTRVNVTTTTTTAAVSSGAQPNRDPVNRHRLENYHGKQQPPNRPGFGTRGRKMTVRTNFYPIILPESMVVFHYDVRITPEKLSKSGCRKVYDEVQRQHLNGVLGAYDGSKSVYYAKRPFTGDSKCYSVKFCLEYGDREREYELTLKRATQFTIDLDHMVDILSDVSETRSMVQALDVILRHFPSLRMVPIGRSFFSKPDRPFPLGAGREVWSGYYQSVRPAMGWKLLLNVDVAATTFYTEQPVFDFMCSVLRGSSPRDATKPLTDGDRRRFVGKELKDSERKQFSREIKGLKIVVSHLSYPRKYKVVDVTRFSPREQTFLLEDESKCTVENYFRKNYPNSPNLYPRLPCLHVGQKTRNIYLPIGVCSIVGGQRCVKKLTDVQTSNMIRHTAKPPQERERTINEAVKKARFNADPVAEHFGIKVSDKMMEVESRVLNPPKLMYHQSSVEPRPGKGAWDMRNDTKFFTAVTVEEWAVVVCSYRCKRDACEKFIVELQKRSTQMGMRMNPRPLVEYRNRRTVEDVFRGLMRSRNLDLIVVITDKGGQDYFEVKRLGDSRDGIAVTTQCVLADTVERKCNPATLGNICLKINARLGGVNSFVDLGTRPSLVRGMPVIIFGADVTHPRSDDTTSPSIASVVASIDLEGGRYRALHRNQKHRQEIIADLKEMAMNHLIAFWESTRQKPVKIIFYRDGVSEGQFDAVRQEEVAAIQGACLELQPDRSYQPMITFIVVQKRHHTRFFPKYERDGDRTGNVPPGTTVDRTITHPTQHDFFLCSHAAIQGTSRPCHYHVLWDDSDFGADALQLLSYQLCHMFWRCNRSVSYPAPTYYAHRDAAHARMLLQAHEGHMSGGSTATTAESISKEEMNRAIEIHENRQNKMYFM